MRLINKIIIHCSDSDNPKHNDISVIDDWHKERGWSGVGYHYFITNEGYVQKGRKEADIGAHAKYHNASSIGICLAGRNEFSDAQYEACIQLVMRLMAKYPKIVMKNILAHNQVSNKTCPNFDVEEKIKNKLLGPFYKENK